MEDTPRRPTALIVEDDKSAELILRVWLTRDGFEVQSVTDGEAALAALAANSFDLIFLDIRLPTLSGLEVARRLRSRGDGTAIIAVTTAVFPVQREDLLAAGIDGIVTKPYLRDELFDVIAAVVANR